MAISEPYSSAGTTISTTEISLVSGTSTLQNITDDGVYQLMIDVTPMAANDQFRIRIKEKATSGGTQRVVYDSYLVGAQSGIFVTPSLILLHGWDMTMIRVAGTDRSISWSIRKVA